MIVLAPRTRDGCANVNDLRIVILQWGPCPNGEMCADTDGNCVVNVNDLRSVTLNWGTVCSSLGAQGSGANESLAVEELIELLLEMVAAEPGLEENVAEAISQLLEE